MSLYPNCEGWPKCFTWYSYCAELCTYIFLAYQSPCSGTHCGLQCAQIPNFASRNQSGQRYDFRDSQNGKNGPSGTCPRKNGESPSALEAAVSANAHAPPRRSDRRFKVAYLPLAGWETLTS